MSRHAKHRADPRESLATPVPTNAAADSSIEGELAAEQEAGPVPPEWEASRSGDDLLTGAQRESELAAHEAAMSERHDQGPSVANPTVGADPDLATDPGDGAAPSDGEGPDEPASEGDAEREDDAGIPAREIEPDPDEVAPEDAAPTAAQEQGWIR